MIMGKGNATAAYYGASMADGPVETDNRMIMGKGNATATYYGASMADVPVETDNRVIMGKGNATAAYYGASMADVPAEMDVPTVEAPPANMPKLWHFADQEALMNYFL